jgi:thioredoxin reductase (NADPH)
MCEAKDVVIVGGGNSAGQAAVFLSQFAAHVHILVRADSLAGSMSRYLIRRIEETPNITLHTRTELVELNGDKHLESVVIRNNVTGESWERPYQYVYLMTGGESEYGMVAKLRLSGRQGICSNGTKPDRSASEGRSLSSLTQTLPV